MTTYLCAGSFPYAIVKFEQELIRAGIKMPRLIVMPISTREQILTQLPEREIEYTDTIGKVFCRGIEIRFR
jgi:hypothetical protein